MTRTCVILQPSYVPWRGVFDQIRRADVFVHYDDVQYDKNGWRNRNRIKGSNGSFWLTIPVTLPGGTRGTRLDRALVAARPGWRAKHWAAIRGSYRRAPCFDALESWLRPHFESREGETGDDERDADERLVDFTIPLQEACATALGIHDTEFVRSSTLGVEGERSARLVEICRRVGADRYLSGPSAQDYLDREAFADAGIDVAWMSYEYPPYPQLHGDFDPQVSIIDALAMLGPDAPAAIF